MIVFPILGGAHVVSEGLAKVFVDRGYAALRLERRDLALATATDPETPARALRHAVIDARRLIDWLAGHSRIDSSRLATAGVSLGGIQAALLAGIEPRIRAGAFLMAGGGLGEILHDSAEVPVRTFRDRMMRSHGLETREDFVSWMRVYTDPVDPLRYAGNLDPATVLMASGRFDRVMPGDRVDALWRALGEPRRIKLPAGHYQLAPFFWWTAGKAADHFDAVLATTR